ncbi:MAG: TetR/AcrR family transcriptional regulator [Colwellia sp.]
MLKSSEKIIIAAQECFFQHGYSAANVSLIARYAGISRATIYKSFCSKEALFRAVVKKHIDETEAALIIYGNSEQDFWQDTEYLIYARCKGIFDDIVSSLVRAELMHAGQLYCLDLIRANQQLEQQAIVKRLKLEIQKKRLFITNIHMSVADFAKVIESVPMGMAFSSLDQNSNELIHNIFQIFKASTQ